MIYIKGCHLQADHSFNDDRTKKRQEGGEDYVFTVGEKVGKTGQESRGHITRKTKNKKQRKKI